jgi:hypothetical protein
VESWTSESTMREGEVIVSSGGGRCPKFIWAPCHVIRTAVLINLDPATPPPPIPQHWDSLLGRYWSAKIDDISVQPSWLRHRVAYPTFPCEYSLWFYLHAKGLSFLRLWTTMLTPCAAHPDSRIHVLSKSKGKSKVKTAKKL